MLNFFARKYKGVNTYAEETTHSVMIQGFEKIVEERILTAQKKGEFENLDGVGKPLALHDDYHVPEELRLAFKILKNADCLPPEIELKKEIRQTEDLLAGMQDTSEKYRLLKKINFLIMKLNTIRSSSIVFEMPQHYMEKLVDCFEKTKQQKSTQTASR
jgi:DnaJ homologue, subfamily C, member 28, conserved domain